MDAFAIYGQQNVGKSTACYKLYLQLLQAGATVLQSSPSVVTDPSKTKKDFCVTLGYHGKTVLIMSDGDDSSIIERNINYAIATQPDKFIFAVRSRIWYRTSVARLKIAAGCTVRFFTLPALQIVPDPVQDVNEMQIANSIFKLI